MFVPVELQIACKNVYNLKEKGLPSKDNPCN